MLARASNGRYGTPEASLNTPTLQQDDIIITLDGTKVSATSGELLVDAINRALPNRRLAQVCYHHSLGPLKRATRALLK